MLFARKAIGMEVSQEGVALAAIGGRKTLPCLEAHHSAPFPADTVRFSLKEQNVLVPESFVTVVREASLRLLTSGTRIALSLPDAAGRVVLLDMETRFKNRSEGADLIRWKLKKSFPFDINEAHLDYQVLQQRESGEISVLVGLIARPVINQYEDLLVEAGLEPVTIDFTTFNVFRLFADRVDTTQQTAFISLYRNTVAILVFSDGALDFYRTKEIHAPALEMNRVFREISSSLLVYHGKKPGQQVQKVFFSAPPQDRESVRGVIAEAIGTEPYLLEIEPIIARSRDKVDRDTCYRLIAAMGAATRNL